MRSFIIALCISLLPVPCVQGQSNISGLHAGLSPGSTDVAPGRPGTGELIPASAPAFAPILVSFRKPDGMILSQGNLYFTSHDEAGAAVWRTAQTAIPGQERILYWEQGAIFGDITFAQVGGRFFGYFFAKKLGVVTIRRVPLEGGAATVLVTVTGVDMENSRRNLVTDGVNLYWQDVTAVRKMPIGGGAITVLDNTRPNTLTAGIALRNRSVIYADVDEIRFVPTGGAIVTPAARTLARARDPVTALHVVSNGVYWGERSGAVRLKVGAVTTTFTSPAGPVPTSISTNGFTAGAALGWTQCGAQTCRLHSDSPGNSGGSTPIGSGALGVDVRSSGKVFWGDAAGVHRTF